MNLWLVCAHTAHQFILFRSHHCCNNMCAVLCASVCQSHIGAWLGFYAYMCSASLWKTCAIVIRLVSNSFIKRQNVCPLLTNCQKHENFVATAAVTAAQILAEQQTIWVAYINLHTVCKCSTTAKRTTKSNTRVPYPHHSGCCVEKTEICQIFIGINFQWPKTKRFAKAI